mmetsp:Transcript_23484/g.55286  ORF Transcript_23484/g.55286 Transcript_23484/m.55286 type:complete len:588 (-) Transcript_23484:4-1767(-)
MKGKRLSQSCFSLAILACCCILFAKVVARETISISSVSATAAVSTTSTRKIVSLPFLRWRAGAFGSSNQDDSSTSTSTADNHDDRTGRKGKKRKRCNGHTNGRSNINDAKVEEYVAAMRERDAGHDPSYCVSQTEMDSNQDGDTTDGSSDTSRPMEDTGSTPTKNQETDNAEDSVVGVKSHKKSNAVGDPDGSDDDDDDDDSDDENDSPSEYSEEWEEMEETFDQFANEIFEPQVEVEVEMVEEEEILDHREQNGGSSRSGIVATKGGGGVGVRLGRIANRRKNNRRKPSALKPSYDQSRLLSAWTPFVYFPPTPSALNFLSNNARILDASSKNRLDRRTLYAGLLLEWGATNTKLSSSTRKFLPASSSQALQAALSIATQPAWRQSAPRTSGIRLYQDGEKTKGSTLGMQETIAMALAHSLGCGMLILDDHVINKVRHQMANCGLSDGEMKPAALIKSLLSLATEGQLNDGENSGSISACMKRDILLGLDDPYDERAIISCDDMSMWEKEWKKDLQDGSLSKMSSKPLPLLIFIRTNTSTNLLKSKSAMELLIHECASNDSIHLVTLGKGIDATTSSLPKEEIEFA